MKTRSVRARSNRNPHVSSIALQIQFAWIRYVNNPVFSLIPRNLIGDKRRGDAQKVGWNSRTDIGTHSSARVGSAQLGAGRYFFSNTHLDRARFAVLSSFEAAYMVLHTPPKYVFTYVHHQIALLCVQVHCTNRQCRFRCCRLFGQVPTGPQVQFMVQENDLKFL